MDIIFIRDLRIETVIGIYPWEREIKQTVSIDLELGTDIGKAAATDTIVSTLDYKAVSKRLIAFVGESHCFLLETLGERIAQLLLAEFQVPWLRLTLSKPGALRDAANVGIIIERRIDD